MDSKGDASHRAHDGRLGATCDAFAWQTAKHRHHRGIADMITPAARAEVSETERHAHREQELPKGFPGTAAFDRAATALARLALPTQAWRPRRCQTQQASGNTDTSTSTGQRHMAAHQPHARGQGGVGEAGPMVSNGRTLTSRPSRPASRRGCRALPNTGSSIVGKEADRVGIDAAGQQDQSALGCLGCTRFVESVRRAAVGVGEFTATIAPSPAHRRSAAPAAEARHAP